MVTSFENGGRALKVKKIVLSQNQGHGGPTQEETKGNEHCRNTEIIILPRMLE